MNPLAHEIMWGPEESVFMSPEQRCHHKWPDSGVMFEVETHALLALLRRSF